MNFIFLGIFSQSIFYNGRSWLRALPEANSQLLPHTRPSQWKHLLRPEQLTEQGTSMGRLPLPRVRWRESLADAAFQHLHRAAERRGSHDGHGAGLLPGEPRRRHQQRYHVRRGLRHTRRGSDHHRPGHTTAR